MLCLNIAESFFQLHAKGFCYQDISLDNLFFNPSNGAVCVVDNDNVDVNGMPGAIYGTRKFMAPEVVRREAFPSTATDLFSMAVLFFYLLHSWHPLDGRREAEIMILDDEEVVKLYGTQPLFIFDPQDASNGPISGMHDSVVRRWKSLSETMRKLLTRSFTAGINPSSAWWKPSGSPGSAACTMHWLPVRTAATNTRSAAQAIPPWRGKLCVRLLQCAIPVPPRL